MMASLETRRRKLEILSVSHPLHRHFAAEFDREKGKKVSSSPGNRPAKIQFLSLFLGFSVMKKKKER